MKTFFAFLAISELFSGYSTAAGQSVATNTDSSKSTLYIPSLIKINSQGRLEKWRIKNLEEYPEHHLKIFNRRGHMVYQSKQYSNTWPERLPTDDKYFYILEVDGKRVSGWIDIEI